MDRLARTAVLLLLLAALGIGVVAFHDATRFVGTPWTGFPLLPNGEVGPPLLAAARVADAPDAPRFQERIVAVDGVPTRGAADVFAHLPPPGTEVRYTVERPGGEQADRRLPVMAFTDADLDRVYLPLFVGGAVGLLLGAVPVLARPRDAGAWAFCLVNVGLAVNFGFLTLDWFARHRFVPLSPMAGALALGGLLWGGVLIPSRLPPARHAPRLTATAAFGIGAAFWSAFAWALAHDAALLRTLDAVEGLLFGGGSALVLANMAWSARSAGDPGIRRLARVILVGLLLAQPAGLLFVASTLGWLSWHPPMTAFLAPFWLFGALLTWAMVAHNLFELDGVVRRALTGALIALGMVAVQVVTFGLTSLWLEGMAAWVVAAATSLIVVAALAAVAPLRGGIETAVERTLFPRQHAARVAVHAASGALARLRGADDIARVLRDAVAQSLAGADVRLLAGAPGEPLVELSPTDGGAPLALPPGDPLHVLLRRGRAVRFDDVPARQASSKAAARRAAELGVRLAIPLPGGEVAGAALLLGPRADARLYTTDDLLLAETLASQTAVALDHARAWEAVKALESRLRAENLYLREEVEASSATHGEIVGRSPALRAVMAQVARVAPTDASVLVEGETGSGKELLVRALHAQSRRADRMLVKVACAALPETLLESELFGYERGAFTGATGAKPGRFEVADGGTLFLDDVDTLPLGVQAKLLRALQEGELQRLGSIRTRHVDVRVVAATNRGLLDEVRAGRFREDLYYRLNVVPLRLPPLRERPEDIAALVEHFIREDGPRLGARVRAVSAEAMAALQAYPWPGNVRELRNVIQRALVLSSDDVLRLPGPLEPQGAVEPGEPSLDGTPLAEQVRALKTRIILAALERSGGNQRAAAELLGLHRQSLTRMIRDLGFQSGEGAPTSAGRRRTGGA